MGHQDRQPSRKNRPQVDFGRAKRSFDSVMAVFRACQYTGPQATDYSRQSSPTTPHSARPSSAEFRIDVSLCFRKLVPACRTERFKAAYCYYDSENPIEQEVVAEHVMGLKRHRIEQRLGMEFIERGIYPVQQYFSYQRKGRDEWKNSAESTIRHERLQEVAADDGDSLPVQPESVVDDAAMDELLTQARLYEVSQGGVPVSESPESSERGVI